MNLNCHSDQEMETDQYLKAAVWADQKFNSGFLGLNIIFVTQHKIIGPKNMVRKKRILILTDGIICVLFLWDRAGPVPLSAGNIDEAATHSPLPQLR